jgi:hypothetical protein
MRHFLVAGVALAVLAGVPLLLPAAAAHPIDVGLAPYAADPEHPWNRLHQALFVRETPDGHRVVHTTDPLLYRGGTFLLDGDSHRKALAALDQFLDRSADRLIDDPLKRLYFQHDLWSAFDYAAWYPDDWVFKSKYEPAALAIRTRLARAVGRLALADRALAALPDNYELAVKSKQYPAAYDPAHPEQPFLPPDLFDPSGPWVRFHEQTASPMARKHYDGAGGRAAHVIFLRLPGGREATERYVTELRGEEPFLKESHRFSVKQFPPGTMVAMVRRALTVDGSAKIRVTPLTELVQIRVYRRIPNDPEAHHTGDVGEQDASEFVLDRAKLFAGQPGLVAVGHDEAAAPLFGRSEMSDSFERNRGPLTPGMPQLKTCIQCHSAPGVYSVLCLERGLKRSDARVFRTYDWDVELNYTVHAKAAQFDWGLLQGKLEAK